MHDDENDVVAGSDDMLPEEGGMDFSSENGEFGEEREDSDDEEEMDKDGN